MKPVRLLATAAAALAAPAGAELRRVESGGAHTELERRGLAGDVDQRALMHYVSCFSAFRRLV